MPISRDKLARIRLGLVGHEPSMSVADRTRFDATALEPEPVGERALGDPDCPPATDEQLDEARMNRRERLGIPLDAPDFDIRTLMRPPYDLSLDEAMKMALSPGFDIKDVPVGGAKVRIV